MSVFLFLLLTHLLFFANQSAKAMERMISTPVPVLSAAITTEAEPPAPSTPSSGLNESRARAIELEEILTAAAHNRRISCDPMPSSLDSILPPSTKTEPGSCYLLTADKKKYALSRSAAMLSEFIKKKLENMNEEIPELVLKDLPPEIGECICSCLSAIVELKVSSNYGNELHLAIKKFVEKTDIVRLLMWVNQLDITILRQYLIILLSEHARQEHATQKLIALTSDAMERPTTDPIAIKPAATAVATSQFSRSSFTLSPSAASPFTPSPSATSPVPSTPVSPQAEMLPPEERLAAVAHPGRISCDPMPSSLRDIIHSTIKEAKGNCFLLTTDNKKYLLSRSAAMLSAVLRKKLENTTEENPDLEVGDLPQEIGECVCSCLSLITNLRNSSDYGKQLHLAIKNFVEKVDVVRLLLWVNDFDVAILKQYLIILISEYTRQELDVQKLRAFLSYYEEYLPPDLLNAIARYKEQSTAHTAEDLLHIHNCKISIDLDGAALSTLPTAKIGDEKDECTLAAHGKEFKITRRAAKLSVTIANLLKQTGNSSLSFDLLPETLEYITLCLTAISTIEGPDNYAENIHRALQPIVSSTNIVHLLRDANYLRYSHSARISIYYHKGISTERNSYTKARCLPALLCSCTNS